jgi:hypothetical protein
LLRSNTIFPSNVAELGVDFLFKGVNFNSAQYAGAISDILKELGLSSVSLGNGKRPAYLYISNKVAFNNSLKDRYLKSFSDDDQIANWLRQKSEEFAANTATQKAATLQKDLHSKQTLEESDDVNTMASDSDIYFESFNDSDLIDLDEDQIIDPPLADFIPKDMQELTIDDLMSVDKGLSASSYLKQCSLFKAQTPSVTNKEPNKESNKQPSLNNDNVFGIEDKKSAEQYLLEAFGLRK